MSTPALLSLGIGVACGNVAPRTVTEVDAGGAGQPSIGGSAGASGSAGDAGTAAGSGGDSGAGTGGSSGSSGDAGEAGMPSMLPPVCTNQSLRCGGDTGNTIEQCQPDGAWQALPIAQQCGGKTPLCSGAGTCAAFRSVGGGIDTFGQYPPGVASYVLTRQTLVETPRVCGAQYCVTGSLKP